MSTTQSKYGRRFDEEFKKEVAALACRPGAKQEQVARDLGVEALQRIALEKALRPGTSGDHVASWRQRGRTRTAHQSPGARERRPARAEDEPKKSGRHCLGTPAHRHGVISNLAGEFSIKALCRVLGRGLGRRRGHAHWLGRPRLRAGRARKPAHGRVAPPLRPRQAVCQRRRPRTAASPWCRAEHEPPGQLL